MSVKPDQIDAWRVLENCCFLSGLAVQSRESVLAAMVTSLGQMLVNFPESEVLASVLKREQVRPTGTPEGVAFPHGKHATIDGVYAALATVAPGIDFGGIRPVPCQIIVLTVSSVYRADGHLHFLAYMARSLQDVTIRAAVLGAKNKAALLDVLRP